MTTIKNLMEDIFDSKYYIRQANILYSSKRLNDKSILKVLSGEVSAFEHFEKQVGIMALNPSPLFDVAYYLQQAKDSLRMNPLKHFLMFGDKAELSPHPLFDNAYYLHSYPEVLGSNQNSLWHYVTSGASELKNPNPLFDASFVANQASINERENPLIEYINKWRRCEINPHPLFDNKYYLKNNTRARKRASDPLADYRIFGFTERSSPHKLFDADFYLASNSDVLSARINPLEHFIRWGIFQQRAPNSFFTSQDFIRAAQKNEGAISVQSLLQIWREDYCEEDIRNLDNQENRMIRLRCHKNFKKITSYVWMSIKTKHGMRLINSGRLRNLTRKSLSELCRTFKLTPVDTDDSLKKDEHILIPAQSWNHKSSDSFFLETGGKVTYADKSQEIFALKAFELKNIAISCESDIILDGAKALFFGALDSEKPCLSEEQLGKYSLNAENNTVTLKSPNVRFVAPVDKAIVLLGVASCNWAHWLTEILPTLAAVHQAPQYKDMPLIMSSAIAPQMLESIKTIIGDHRRLILLRPGISWWLNTAVCPTLSARVIYHPNLARPARAEDSIFSPIALQQLRTKILDSFGLLSDKEVANKRVYLKRNSNRRCITNSADLENYFRQLAFEIVEPEKLSFRKQVELFNSAKLIVGQAGAGMMNLLFCRPKTTLVLFGNYSKSANFWYFLRPANIVGVKLTFLLSESDAESSENYQRDFSVDLAKMEEIANRENLW